MKDILINRLHEKALGWVFEVKLEDHTYQVSLSQDYYQKLTSGKVSPEGLIKLSFEFLLEREPASAILSQFELPIINRYSPTYEGYITDRLQ